jgi:hypothetical protein
LGGFIGILSIFCRLHVRENGEIVTVRDLAKSLSYLAARKLTHPEDYGRRSYDWPNPFL